MAPVTMTLRELVAHAATLLSQHATAQPSGRVSEVPTQRTIRYYARHGLLEKPVGWRGRAALYGPKHLLALLAIKRLQARGESLDAIQEVLAGAREAELEKLADVTHEDVTLFLSSLASPEPAAPGLTPRRADFWAQQPAPVSQTLPPAPAPAQIIGQRLTPGVTLLLEQARRPLDEADRAAILAAAQPLLRLLEARHLTHHDTHSSPAEDSHDDPTPQ